MKIIGPAVIARQKSHTAASSIDPASCSRRAGGTYLAAGGEGERRPRARCRTSGGETRTSSGLRGPRKRSGAGAASKVARFSKLEARKSSLVWGKLWLLGRQAAESRAWYSASRRSSSAFFGKRKKTIAAPRTMATIPAV